MDTAQYGEVTLLLNGLVWSGLVGDGHEIRHNEAIAIGDGRVLAVGSNRELRARFTGSTQVDLGGRAVVPGIIDGHSHAVRGGLNWKRELHWGGLNSPDQAMASIRAAAAAAAPGEWITAIGGWHQSQFSGWLPSREALDAAAPDNPVYVQSLYEVGIANSAALEAVPLARHANGAPTGAVTGLPAFNLFATAAGTPDLSGQREGTKAMIRDFASIGITGVCDPGGFGMDRTQYAAIDSLAAAGELDVRFRLYLSATLFGSEAEQIAEWLRDPRFDTGDDWLRTIGIGEVVHFGCHDFEGLEEFTISDTSLSQLQHISLAVAKAGRPMHLHAVTDESITRILDCWEQVDRAVPIGELRFSLAHADRISRLNLRRAAALGVGVVVDARQAFRSTASQRVWGPAAMRSVPPLGDLLASGIRLGAGSDATRASSHNPWHTLWWLVVGRSVDRSSQRDDAHLLSRVQALSVHTEGNAWFSFEGTSRGRLDAGWHSDLTVLDSDYFRVEPDGIREIRSDLTIVGNRVSYSSGEVVEAT